MSFLDKKIEDCMCDDIESSIVFECDDLDFYEHPNEEDVSEDLYAAMVMGFQSYTDRFKNRYLDVCYKAFSNHTYLRWKNEAIDKIMYSYIRIRIMVGSDEERQFRAAMSKLCDKKKFTSDELIGIILLINIAYEDGGKVIIKNYDGTQLTDEWFVDDLDEE